MECEIKGNFSEVDECLQLIQEILSETNDTRREDLKDECSKIILKYQERPELLDAGIHKLFDPLISVLLDAGLSGSYSQIPYEIPLILYTMITVRGLKSAMKLFSSNLAHLEPILKWIEWEMKLPQPRWELKFVLLTWLSLILFTPFDITSLDTSDSSELLCQDLLDARDGKVSLDTHLKHRVLFVGICHLNETGRLRDAAALLLSRLFHRQEMSSHQLSEFLKFVKHVLDWDTDDVTQSFLTVGVLDASLAILKILPSNDKMFDNIQGFTDVFFHEKTHPALERKTQAAGVGRLACCFLPTENSGWKYKIGKPVLLKSQKVTNPTHKSGNKWESFGNSAEFDDLVNIASDEVPPVPILETQVPREVDGCVDTLLLNILDQDTIVRWSAAKALGRLAARLPLRFVDEILQRVLQDCFTFRETEKGWHGGCLCIAELCRRGSIQPNTLPLIIPLVCKALLFESHRGSLSVGGNVRDAACYVAWTFARAFSAEVLGPYFEELSSHLLQVALFDKEVNCRRAAGGSIQEHVGRQGQFPDGISLVNLMDYFNLSGIRNCYLSLALEVAELRGEMQGFGIGQPSLAADPEKAILFSNIFLAYNEDADLPLRRDIQESHYAQALIKSLVTLKLVSPDIGIRKLAANGVGTLARIEHRFMVQHVVPFLLKHCESPQNQGMRHGYMLALGHCTRTIGDLLTDAQQLEIRNLVPKLERERAYRGRGGEMIREAAIFLLTEISTQKAITFAAATGKRYIKTANECLRHFTESVQVGGALCVQAVLSRLTQEDKKMVLDGFLHELLDSSLHIAARRGYCLTLGFFTEAELAPRVLWPVCREILPNLILKQDDIDSRKFALVSLAFLVENAIISGLPIDYELIIFNLLACMDDYSIDRRGDVGSWLREISLEIFQIILEGTQSKVVIPGVTRHLNEILSSYLRQALERIDRVRARSSYLLHRLLSSSSGSPSALPYQAEDIWKRTFSEATSECLHVESSTKLCRVEPRCLYALPHVDLLHNLCSQMGTNSTEEDIVFSVNTNWSDIMGVFPQLCNFLEVPELRHAVLRGILIAVAGHSAGQGKCLQDGFLKYLEASRFLLEISEIIIGFLEVRPSLSELPTFDELEKSGKAQNYELSAFPRLPYRRCLEDRYIQPSLMILTLMIERGLLRESLYPRILDEVQEIFVSSPHMQRLKACIPLVLALTEFSDSQLKNTTSEKALAIGLSFLLHEYPRLRQVASELAYVKLLEAPGEEGEIPLAILVETPWSSDDFEAIVEARERLFAHFNIQKLDLPSISLEGKSEFHVSKAEKQTDKDVLRCTYADLVREEHY